MTDSEIREELERIKAAIKELAKRIDELYEEKKK